MPGMRAGVVAAVMVLGACGSAGEPSNLPVVEAPEASRQQAASPLEPPPADARVVDTARAANHLGFAVHAGLLVEHEGLNVVTSPWSLTALLAIVAAAAEGETAAELETLLGDAGGQDEGLGLLADSLRSATSVQLRLATGLWANSELAADDAALAALAERFDAQLVSLPLGEASAATAIDQWVTEQTDGMIRDLAEPLGLPDPQLPVAVATALAFVGDWTQGFDEQASGPGTFILDDGVDVEVPMMRRTDTPTLWFADADLEVVRLPYGEDERFGMEVFLPLEDLALGDLVQGLDADRWVDIVQQFRATDVEVVLPSFSLRSSVGLTGVLEDLGVARAFGAQAQFGPIATGPLSLTDVAQVTFVEVTEQGTRAAAASAGSIGDDDAAGPLVFEVDRPFLFTISDRDTGAVLLLGTIHDPRG